MRRSSRRRRAARSRWGVLLPTLLVGLVLAVVVARTGLPDLTPLPGAPFPPSALAIDADLRIDLARVPTQAAIVAYVLDGDSLVVRIAGRESRIQLYGAERAGGRRTLCGAGAGPSAPPRPAGRDAAPAPRPPQRRRRAAAALRVPGGWAVA